MAFCLSKFRIVVYTHTWLHINNVMHFCNTITDSFKLKPGFVILMFE